MRIRILPERLEEKFLLLVLAVCLVSALFFAEAVVQTERQHVIQTAEHHARYIAELQAAGIDVRSLFNEHDRLLPIEDPALRGIVGNPLLDPRVTGLRAKLFLSAILLVGVLVIALRVVFRRLVLARVHSLERATRSLAARERIEFPETGNDEIGSLITAFREMVVSLEHREAELVIRNEQLKSEVRGRKAAVESLRESENKFRVLFEQHTDGIVVTIDGEVVHGNGAAAKMFGYESADELLYVRPRDTWPVYQPDGSPSYEAAQSHMAQAFEHGTHTYEWVYKRRDGTLFWTDVVATVIPYEGRRALYSVIRDISSRKLEEEEHVRLTAAMEQTVEMIVVSDANGSIQYVNPAFLEITGYSRKEVLGQSHDIVHGLEQDNPNHGEMREAISGGKVWKGKLVSRKRDGTRYQSETTISPVRDTMGRIIDYVTVSHDITKEARLEAQLVQAQKMEAIGELASGIAHEINTPTQYIGDNVRFLHESYEEIDRLLERFISLHEEVRTKEPENPKISEIDELVQAMDLEYLREELPSAIKQSMEGNRRVAEIVRAMKEFAHPGTEEMSPVDINQAIRNTIAVARNEWKYVAEVQTDLESTLPMVNCVPGLFNQVILNIFVNAAHAIGEVCGKSNGDKGTITVSTRQDEEWVEVRISDSGTGIPPKIRTKIFDPFFTTKGVGKGTGQGLAMAHTVIVDKHKGSLTFETEEGKGTTFIIRLRIVGVVPELHETEEIGHGIEPAKQRSGV
jgi:two-component system, NtrC family, sensor kinase